jgi:hypothetical protein
MGEQYVDLFAAGAYALEGKLLDALAQPEVGWVFYVLAAAGVIVSIAQSAAGGAPTMWMRHLATVAIASVLILTPHRIELADLTYAAPGAIETIFGTRTGAAPHLTYLIERFGAIAASRVRDLMHNRPSLAVPSVAAQVGDLTSDPATLDDPQLKANLQIWRECIVPALLHQHGDLKASILERNLVEALMNPAPPDEVLVGAEVVRGGAAVRALLASSEFDLVAVVTDASLLARSITDSAGAEAWVVGSSSVQLSLAQSPPPTLDPPITASPAYYDAISRGTSLAMSMIDELPQSNGATEVTNVAQLHEMLGRSILYVAGVSYLRQDSRLAALGSFCQRLGDAACRAAQSPLIRASGALRVPPADRYNTASITTWLKQPLATALLAVASLLLGALSSLIVAVLPFLFGVAKAIAILMSSIGLWMMLWPGRLRDALSWMVLPVSFVALWSVLFNLWADLEPFLSSVATVVGHSDYGSFSAGRIMSIAISIGYLGLPAVALSILSGNALRTLDHVGARLETAMLMAWRTRRTVISVGRRWLTNSPLARRWNQRVYRAVGLGSLRSTRPTARTRRPGASPGTSSSRGVRNATTRSDTKATAPPAEDFKLE